MSVLEVNRPDRGNRRRKGRSDPIDAAPAARSVLAGQATAVPKNRDGAVEALRALTSARNSAVKATTTASNQIKALLVGADQELRDQLLVQSLLQMATRCSDLALSNGQRAALASLGRRLLATPSRDPPARHNDQGPHPTDRSRTDPRPGIGIRCAAKLLIPSGANPDRLHSDAAFAALCGF